jgi:hypothetical protein
MIENQSNTPGKLKLRISDFIIVLRLALMRGVENYDCITHTPM